MIAGHWMEVNGQLCHRSTEYMAISEARALRCLTLTVINSAPGRRCSQRERCQIT